VGGTAGKRRDSRLRIFLNGTAQSSDCRGTPVRQDCILTS